ncbi:hypothetical protein [Polymorphospora rubra]|uniref:Uncharacterized protein n=1 Tax=Polymorphospora rubra TaxID=338584 RepID=A0A810N988_9ACTN|nr:hypothetical protein [Polymorphospora rubra]BCJ67945.1 hypothetical protein Prubr_49660 [Polymorphospora rubra]
MTVPGRPGPPPGGARPGPPPGGPRPAPPAGGFRPAAPGDGRWSADGDALALPTVAGAGGSGHPAVDAAIQAMANAADLPPADQIAQYEAAHRTLQETLATIDHG